MWALGATIYEMLYGLALPEHRMRKPASQLRESKVIAFPDEEDGICVSDDAKDGIRGLLQRDPNLRLTPKQVMEHVWMRSNLGRRPRSPQS
jgi:calcium-dependent protein kinase